MTRHSTSRPRHRTTVWAAALAAASLAAAGLLAPGAQATSPRGMADLAQRPVATTATPSQVVAPVPVLDWQPCFSMRRAPRSVATATAAAAARAPTLLCTTARVPLDYDDPTGPTTRLFLSKLPASHPAQRIGSLFVNPGGPGGNAAGFAPYAAHLLGAGVHQRFDVIGIDPRGVGGSVQVQCHTADRPVPYPNAAFPWTPGQVKVQLRYNAHLRHTCAAGGNAILDHMTTADTARDMDLIRQAVGEARLSYYGISYGSYLGATYAAMFPDRIRAMIVDGVLDPVAWSTGRSGLGDKLPFSTRLRSGVGAWDALVSAFDECDRVGKQRCLLSGTAQQKWLRIVHLLKRHPVMTDEGVVRYPDVIGYTLGPLYDRAGYRYLMRDIQRVYRSLFGPDAKLSPAQAMLSLKHLGERAARRNGGPFGSDAWRSYAYPSFEGVACSDSVNPDKPTAWIRAGKIADSQGPWFGRLWTWLSSPCARWPGSSADAFRGPWRTRTSAPLLVVGNFHDPATPISGARHVNSLFRGSRLMTLRTWGHGALSQSQCITTRYSRYLLNVDLPVQGLVCAPDKALFPARQ
ncbi:MAG: alpha/beta fold hydrolase [Nocardioidaceae bacterium]